MEKDDFGVVNGRRNVVGCIGSGDTSGWLGTGSGDHRENLWRWSLDLAGVFGSGDIGVGGRENMSLMSV